MTGRHRVRPPIRLIGCCLAGVACIAFAGGWTFGPDGTTATVTAAPAVRTPAPAVASRCGERLPLDTLATAIGQALTVGGGGRD